jgi:hypothetical protein
LRQHMYLEAFVVEDVPLSGSVGHGGLLRHCSLTL